MKRILHKHMQMIIGYMLLIAMSWSYSPIQLFIITSDFFTNNNLNQHNHSSQTLHHKNHTTDKLTLKGYLNDYENSDGDGEEEYNDKKTDIKHSSLILKNYNNYQILSLSFVSLKIKTALIKSFLKYFSNPCLYIRHSIYRL